MTDYRRLRVALLGAGAVGSQVADLLLRHGDELADRAGAALDLVGIAVRDPDAPRDAELPRELALGGGGQCVKLCSNFGQRLCAQLQLDRLLADHVLVRQAHGMLMLRLGSE